MPKKPKTKKIKDTDYLTISARIRGMENTLMNRDKMEQLLETHSDEEVTRILQEYGYPTFSLADPEELDEAFSNVRRNIWKDLEQSMPDPRYLDVFRMKYDYHNVKAVLKAEAMHTSPDSMLSDQGRVPAEEVKRYVSSRGAEGELPPILAEASKEARQVLESTRDPQLCDMVLDRARFQEELRVAEVTGSRFLQGYVRDCIDAANLQTLVRCLRVRKSKEFLAQALIEGGDISTDVLTHVEGRDGRALAAIYQTPGFKAAAEASSVKGFEKSCDDAVTAYLADSQLIAFGEAPVINYIAALETEFTNLRIILLGRKAGLSPMEIRGHLRNSYV